MLSSSDMSWRVLMESSAELKATAMSHGLELRWPVLLASRIEWEIVLPRTRPPKEWPISTQWCNFLSGARVANASSLIAARQPFCAATSPLVDLRFQKVSRLSLGTVTSLPYLAIEIMDSIMC